MQINQVRESQIANGLDHGVLNVPLGKRGDIDRQIDTYKVKQAAEAKRAAKEASKQHRELKAQAKELLALHCEAIVARHGERFGVKALRHQLDQWAKWEPRKLITFVHKFVSEQA